MFDQLLKLAHNLNGVDSPLDGAELPLQDVPDHVTIEDLREFTSRDHDVSDTRSILWAVYTTLKSGKPRLRLGDGDNAMAALEDILLRIGHIMEPVCSGGSFDDDSTDYPSIARRGELSLHIIAELVKLSRDGLVIPTRTILSIIAYTNPDDPWSSSPCAELSQSLLSAYFRSSSSFQPIGAGTRPGKVSQQTEQERFITEDVLTSFLRPLFAKSRPTTVTASGRPAAFPEPPSRYSQGDGFGGDADDIAVTKPWKYKHRYAVAIFEWAVENADTDLLQQHWPLYTPILLTLLDEPQPTSLKLRSLSIFRVFWSRCPEGLLSRIGLADVFEQAVFPTVLSLPSLTPEAESLALLNAAYPALFDMAGFNTASTIPSSSVDDPMEAGNTTTAENDRSDRPKNRNQGFTEAQRKLLDKIVREGIMVGYHHAKEHIRLVDFLCRTLCYLMSGIGILSVKYLKDLIPLVTEILTDPFGTKYPPTLLSATRLLQEVLQACWPRMPHYCNEILRSTMLCWLNVEDDDSFPSDKLTKTQLKEQLIKTIEILSAIMAAAKLNMSDRVSPLVAKEPQLQPLFACCESR